MLRSTDTCASGLARCSKRASLASHAVFPLTLCTLYSIQRQPCFYLLDLLGHCVVLVCRVITYITVIQTVTERH